MELNKAEVSKYELGGPGTLRGTVGKGTLGSGILAEVVLIEPCPSSGFHITVILLLSYIYSSFLIITPLRTDTIASRPTDIELDQKATCLDAIYVL